MSIRSRPASQERRTRIDGNRRRHSHSACSAAGFTTTLGLLAKLKQPIEFDAIDGQAVDIVFILLLPAATENGQLGALALVARTLRPLENLARLRSAKNTSQLYSAIV
jgi:mannitol/fructose-specific phosphotransferase system IIA component (Ntr-type)